jgi:hypothetical protein
MEPFSLSVLYGTSLRLRQTYSLRYRDFKIRNRETTDMHLANRFVTALFLTAALVASVSIVAAATPQASVQVRVYDSHHMTTTTGMNAKTAPTDAT